LVFWGFFFVSFLRSIPFDMVQTPLKVDAFPSPGDPLILRASPCRRQVAHIPDTPPLDDREKSYSARQREAGAMSRRFDVGEIMKPINEALVYLKRQAKLQSTVRRGRGNPVLDS
jgi:hypothetical protein